MEASIALFWSNRLISLILLLYVVATPRFAILASFLRFVVYEAVLLGHVHVPILMWLDNSAASFSAARLPDSSQSRVCLRPSSGAHNATWL
jgi:hypothetical protein